jgi:hypothetical protein
MKLCLYDCQAACDFCVHFEFNGQPYYDDNGIWKGTAYTGDGWCLLHQRATDPGWKCEDFECRNYDENPQPG